MDSRQGCKSLHMRDSNMLRVVSSRIVRRSSTRWLILNQLKRWTMAASRSNPSITQRIHMLIILLSIVNHHNSIRIRTSFSTMMLMVTSNTMSSRKKKSKTISSVITSCQAYNWITKIKIRSKHPPSARACPKANLTLINLIWPQTRIKMKILFRWTHLKITREQKALLSFNRQTWKSLSQNKLNCQKFQSQTTDKSSFKCIPIMTMPNRKDQSLAPSPAQSPSL